MPCLSLVKSCAPQLHGSPRWLDRCAQPPVLLGARLVTSTTTLVVATRLPGRARALARARRARPSCSSPSRPDPLRVAQHEHTLVVMRYTQPMLARRETCFNDPSKFNFKRPNSRASSTRSPPPKGRVIGRIRTTVGTCGRRRRPTYIFFTARFVPNLVHN